MPVKGVRAAVPPAASARALLQPWMSAGRAQVVALEGSAEISGDGRGPRETQRAEPALPGTGLQPHTDHAGRVSCGGREGNHSKIFSTIVATVPAATAASWASGDLLRSGSVRTRAGGRWSGSGNASGAGAVPANGSGEDEVAISLPY